ncbi:MAG: hypothetical protein J6J81_01520 [Oscillospiraceae bacterium]|nr:hypothetical protein [Oscillospiraceae bacterium]
MGKRKFNAVAVGIMALIVALVVLMMVNNLRRTSHITLPELDGSSLTDSSAQPVEDGVIRVEVTPETVGYAVETLARPTEYRRLLTTERFWSGGSGTSTVTVTVGGGWSRADTADASGRVRHTVTDGVTTYVWYDGETEYYTGPAGDVSPDQEQGIPTYEDILSLRPGDILTADYREWNGTDCIYVETAEDREGRSLRYWVSVSDGLLSGAELLEDGAAVWQTTAQSVTDPPPGPEDFTLPDGTVLWTGTAEGA